MVEAKKGSSSFDSEEMKKARQELADREAALKAREDALAAKGAARIMLNGSNGKRL